MLPNNLTQLIMVLLAPATAGAVVSWLAERWPRFQALSSGWKVVMIAVIAFLFGGVAAVLKLIVEGSPQTTVELLNLLWLGGMTAVMALLGSQMWHEKYNKVRGELEKLPVTMRAGPPCVTLAGVTQASIVRALLACAAPMILLAAPGDSTMVEAVRVRLPGCQVTAEASSMARSSGAPTPETSCTTMPRSSSKV